MDTVFFKLFVMTAACCGALAVDSLHVNVTQYPDGDLMLTCFVDGAVLLPVQWSFNHSGIVMQLQGGTDGSNIQVLTNNSVIIRHLSNSNVGVYICTYTSDEITRISKINIKRAPNLRIERVPLDNADLLLTCYVDGMTNALISWEFLRDGSIIQLEDEGDDGHVRVLDNNTLIIRDFRRDDEGKYICNFTYSAGIYKTATANVMQRLPVRISTYLADNLDLFITCLIDGSPPEDITWEHEQSGDAGALSVGNENSHIQILGNGTLLIRETTPDDTGTYTCNVTLPDGSWKVAQALVGGAGRIAGDNRFIMTALASLIVIIHTLF